ncbi:unnamed protein product [Microthlaspi erraticum]|uniref:Transcription initiation factor IIF subunit alpha n=1 Tax=Microthlaspi erraticum TaxID=1685480 RepID=A0A6D2KR06_9BRAS|nr:unnamed protein product [Microthlaspi erraticum]
MSHCLTLKPSCMGCGSQSDLYGSACRHMTLCLKCGKTMAENKAKCLDCGTPVTRLIREYNVRASTATEKNYFIGRFVTGLPNFKKGSENKWSLRKDIPQGRQYTDAQREKLKNRPWVLEDETGQFQYQGQLEGSQSATYYLLVMQNKEFIAIPAGSWYNFNKVAQYKQLTLEEAEEKMKNRRKTADGYQRWMMKAANNGPALFGEREMENDKESGGSGGAGGGRGRKKSAGGEEEEGNVSDRGEEDEEEEASRKSRLGLNKKSNDDDEENPRGGDLNDMDDDDIEKGDDWEHEEIFTDDDEAVGNDPEEREDLLAPEIPAPPEIKQDEDDEENEEEEGGLSKSGKELKKLLGKSNGLNESDEEEDDDSDEEEETNFGPATNSKQKDAMKEEAVESSPPKPAPSSVSSRGTPSAKPSKGKRKLNDADAKKPSSSSSVQKKVKTEIESKSLVKEEKSSSVSKSNVPTKAVKPEPASAASTSAATGAVTEDEIRAVLMEKKQVTTQDLVSRFKARLKTKEDKNGFAEILRKISKIQKNAGSQNFNTLFLVRLSLDAKVIDAVRNNGWNLPSARSVEIKRSRFCLLLVLCREDVFLWRSPSGSYSQRFSSKGTWEQLRVSSPTLLLSFYGYRSWEGDLVETDTGDGEC